MGIPSQVKKQGRESDRLSKEFLENDLNYTGEKPADKPADAPKPASPGADNWEKRFKGLKKTHDITVSGLRKDLRDALDRIKTIESSALAPKAPAAPVSQKDAMDVLTDKEKLEYSPEFLDMVTRIASRVAGAGTADSTLETRVANLEVDTTETKEDKFWGAIDAAIPDWRKTQATEDMQAWLLEYDDLLGMVRSEAVASAQSRLDANRVIAIFNQYTAPAVTTILDDPEAELLSPELGGGDDGLPASSDDKIWTTTEIGEFYKKLALGKFKGKAGRERAAQIEKSIEKARDDERIVQR